MKDIQLFERKRLIVWTNVIHEELHKKWKKLFYLKYTAFQIIITTTTTPPPPPPPRRVTYCRSCSLRLKSSYFSAPPLL
jgi:hypothetical protein